VVTNNRILVEIAAIPENVGVARLLVAMVAAGADFTLPEIDEIKLAVSEAVTNAVVHAYMGRSDGTITLEVTLAARVLTVTVLDQGTGIADIARARQPAVSSDPERMGLGFCFMETHMDSLSVESTPGSGTRVTMTKRSESGHLARTAN
jgi:stage II sporulation protein AB (anti-sigma F factor)